MSEARTAVREELAVVPREQAGMLAMATMPEDEFEQRLVALKRGQDRIKRIKQELMEEDTHYGVIPGTKKPTLLKPGAEVLCSIYGLRPDFIMTMKVGDGITNPTLRVMMRCELHLGDIAGPVVAVGYGAANSWERRYRYRRGERHCPACGVVGNVIKGKDEYGGGWLCYAKKGGCGAKFPDGSPEIEGQQVGDVDNQDPYDLENTIVKMSKKRAHLDAALTGTASSDLFTQDLDEQEDPKSKRRRRTAQSASEPPPEHDEPWEPGEDHGEDHGEDVSAEAPPLVARAARPAPYRRASAPPSADKEPCPHCGNPAGESKYPKKGQTHYCYSCRYPFDPSGAKRTAAQGGTA